jgi:hypothetical protein
LEAAGGRITTILDREANKLIGNAYCPNMNSDAFSDYSDVDECLLAAEGYYSSTMNESKISPDQTSKEAHTKEGQFQSDHSVPGSNAS